MGAGLLLGALPATASPRAPVSASIVAKSKDPVVTGDVWTVYGDSHFDTATVSGKVSGAPAHSDVRLVSEVFPFKAVTTVGSKVLPSSSAYSFTVEPDYATKYWVEVFGPGAPSSPIATSSRVVVYVTSYFDLATPFPACARPVCHERGELIIRLPAAAAGREVAKKIYAYFALNLSPVKEPVPPKRLKLTDHFSFGSLKKISATEYQRTLSFSFTIDNDGYYYEWDLCTKDTEAADGLGLPGSHSCGAEYISTKIKYLG